MSHGFARIFTDKQDLCGVHSLVMDRLRTNLKHSGLTARLIRLLLTFGLKPQFRRLLFDNERKQIRENPRESVAKVFA
jgi:hypothetical protein